jgi:rhodanese-related sulfurtransferase
VVSVTTLALATSAVALCQDVPDRPLEFMSAIEAKHPGVPWVSTASLAAELENDEPVLLDVRTRDEYATSHIRGAMRVEPGSDPSRLDLPSGRPVVVYCSIGYRSADFAERLRARGIQARNLAGGIFQWANEGRPMVDDGEATQLVHPYDATWGRLVDPEHRAPLP